MVDKYRRPIYNALAETTGADNEEPQLTIDGAFNPEDMDSLSIVNGTPDHSISTTQRYVRRGQRPRSEEEELDLILKELNIDLPDVD